MKWVRTKDRLPDSERLVLCYQIKAELYHTGYWCAPLQRWLFDLDCTCEDITHWQDLPSKPNE